MHYVTAPLQVDHRQYQLTYFKTNRLSLIDDLPDLGLIQEVNFVPVAWHVKKKKTEKKTGFMHYCSRSAAVCRRIEDVPGRCHTTMLSEERSAKGESAVSFTCFTCRGQQALYSDWIGKPRLLFGRNCYLASKSPVLRVSPRPPLQLHTLHPTVHTHIPERAQQYGGRAPDSPR